MNLSLNLVIELKSFDMKFSNVFKHNLLFSNSRYDYYFKAGTHSSKLVPGILSIYNPAHYLELSKEIKQIWTGLGNFEICLCVLFDCCYQKFISRRKTGHQHLPICDFSNNFIFPKILSLKSII